MRCYAKPHVNATPCVGPRPSDIDESGDEQMRRALMLPSQGQPRREHFAPRGATVPTYA